MAIIISADEIKKQIRGYSPEEAEKFHRESARQADKDFEQALKSNPDYKKVILLNGGTASGKTEFLSSYLSDEHAIVFDGTLSTKEGARIKIKKVKKANKRPFVCSVIPDDLSKAFIAFLNRERKFSDEHFYRTHSGARKTLLWIAENYPQVRIKIYENSFGEKQDISFEEILFDNRRQQIEFLKKVQYNEDEIVRIVNKKL